MKIIVTGGSGFIGKALIPRLVAEGHEVVLLTRNPPEARSKVDQRVNFVQWDGKTSDSWESHVDGADAVLNFAGEPLDAKRWSTGQKKRIIDSRVDATTAIVNAIRKASRRPSVLVNASGVGYYGPVETGEITEEHSRGSDFLSETTSQWETAARAAEPLGVRTVILRTAVVLGDGGGALRKLLIPFRLFVGGALGSGRQWFPWIHRDDLVGVILFVLQDKSVSGSVNAVAPESVTMKEFCSALGRVMHRPSWAPVPSFLLKMVLGEMSVMVLTGQRAVPKALQRHEYTFKFPNLSSALSDILR
jgi:uncharacterized protein (TIGR01777 family)